jgi:hypothetical protein
VAAIIRVDDVPALRLKPLVSPAPTQQAVGRSTSGDQESAGPRDEYGGVEVLPGEHSIEARLMTKIAPGGTSVTMVAGSIIASGAPQRGIVQARPGAQYICVVDIDARSFDSDHTLDWNLEIVETGDAERRGLSGKIRRFGSPDGHCRSNERSEAGRCPFGRPF